MEEKQGVLTEIIYQNELNSYIVGVLETENDEITVVGYLPFVKKGDTLKVIGKTVEHKDYGEQFKIETFEKLMPQTLAALETYLASGNIKRIGPSTAKKIIKTFGEQTIHVLKFEPEKLEQIKGINHSKAIEISESFIENQELWQIVGFLEKFGIGAERAKKVYDLFGINAIAEIEANPYILIDISKGVDFKQIDGMAIKMGVERENQKRVKSGIKYALIKITYNGHCCTLKSNLIEYVRQLLGVSEEIINEGIINLKVNNEIVVEEREEEWVYLYTFFKTEEQIAKRILGLEKSRNIKKVNDIEKELDIIEMRADIQLSDKQKEAIKTINENNVTIITGGPGTGKTTIIKSIIEIYKQKKYKIVLAAPTGRAAKRMTETTGEDASTLHRLLEIGRIDEESLFKDNSDHKGAPIDADIVIVDEVSMVDMFIMNYLLGCIYKGAKLILVGDSDQLQSVGAGSVLQDFIDSEIISTVHLDKIFRQAAKSKIIVNAHRVNCGKKFIGKDDEELEQDSKQDFFFIKENNQEKILEQVLSLCNGRLKKFGSYNFFENIQVLSSTKKGLLGTKELNKALQDELNPHRKGEAEKNSMGTTFRIGDRVMQIKNNYDISWSREIEGIEEMNSGIFNGETGIITDIDEKEKNITVRFDDEKVCVYEFNELEQLEHSYCITIHKAQGSEFDVVIMIAHQAAPMLLTRNLLYTGLTRAKKLLIVIGNEKIVDFMINNVDSKKRNTGLKYKMKTIEQIQEDRVSGILKRLPKNE
ncbi:MAG: ATP-dependent RecD-like DNA helicase [Clostridia bacterium]|nr:ATP-dependent RecD-like DNA helicase [Clostridia bacterium]